MRGLALRSWRQFFASFAVKKNLTAKNAKDSQRTQSKSLGHRTTEPLPSGSSDCVCLNLSALTQTDYVHHTDEEAGYRPQPSVGTWRGQRRHFRHLRRLDCAGLATRLKFFRIKSLHRTHIRSRFGICLAFIPSVKRKARCCCVAC